ncbi:MAG: hypothetical protein U1E76_00490 [Planctomycetota bacterium]
MPRSRQRDLEQLVATWSATAERVARGHFAAHAEQRRDHGPELGAWLAAQRPRLLVTGAAGAILWDPDQPLRLRR